MYFEVTQDHSTPLLSNLPVTKISVDGDSWYSTAQRLRQSEASLLALWGADDRDRDGCFHIYAAYLTATSLLVLKHAVESSTLTYPDIG